MKVTDKIQKKAAELAEKHGLKKIFVNENGEFFSEKCHAANSVGGDSKKYTEISLGAPVEPVKSTNDLGKLADVIAAIDAATDTETVRAILDAEVAGKDRKSVIEAASKKIAVLTTKQGESSDNEGTKETGETTGKTDDKPQTNSETPKIDEQ